MTVENLSEHIRSPWYGFWRALKEGDDFFESHGRPPNVRVLDLAYVFEPDR